MMTVLPPDELTARRWYAKPDDLIGGWCVMAVDLTPAEASEADPRVSLEIGNFMVEQIARVIADEHNRSLGEAAATEDEPARPRIALAPDITTADDAEPVVSDDALQALRESHLEVTVPDRDLINHLRALELLAGQPAFAAVWDAVHLAGTGRGPWRMVVPANADAWTDARAAAMALLPVRSAALVAGRSADADAYSYAINIANAYYDRASLVLSETRRRIA